MRAFLLLLLPLVVLRGTQSSPAARKTSDPSADRQLLLKAIHEAVSAGLPDLVPDALALGELPVGTGGASLDATLTGTSHLEDATLDLSSLSWDTSDCPRSTGACGTPTRLARSHRTARRPLSCRPRSTRAAMETAARRRRQVPSRRRASRPFAG